MSRRKTEPARRPGRPTKFDAGRAKTILTYLRAGAYVETAAAAAGISKDTLYNWLRRGARVGEKPTREELALQQFSDAVKMAMAKAELDDLTTIRAASKKNWQAAAWRLERKYPDRWGNRITTRVEFPLDGDSDDDTNDPVERLARLLALQAERAAAAGDTGGAGA